MPKRIHFKVKDLVLEAEFNDSGTAAALSARLPFTFRMSRWGEEYYGDIGDPLGKSLSADARDLMEIGELANWPPGNALCVFFGPTPASTGDEPRAASPVNPVGRILNSCDKLKELGSSIEVTVSEAD